MPGSEPIPPCSFVLENTEYRVDRIALVVGLCTLPDGRLVRLLEKDGVVTPIVVPTAEKA